MTENEKFMNIALSEAKIAYKKDEVPIGAVIVYDGKVIAKAHNKREKSKDATAHAEILAIRKACKKLKDFRLLNCDIYVTLEPCVMCLGALLNARVRNIYIGAPANKEGAIKSEELIERAELNHKSKVVRGVLEEDCSKLISEYFLDKRKGLK